MNVFKLSVTNCINIIIWGNNIYIYTYVIKCVRFCEVIYIYIYIYMYIIIFLL